MSPKTEEVKVRMTEELADALREQAVRQETSVSQIVRVAVRRYLVEREAKNGS